MNKSFVYYGRVDDNLFVFLMLLSFGQPKIVSDNQNFVVRLSEEQPENFLKNQAWFQNICRRNCLWEWHIYQLQEAYFSKRDSVERWVGQGGDFKACDTHFAQP